MWHFFAFLATQVLLALRQDEGSAERHLGNRSGECYSYLQGKAHRWIDQPLRYALPSSPRSSIDPERSVNFNILATLFICWVESVISYYLLANLQSKFFFHMTKFHINRSIGRCECRFRCRRCTVSWLSSCWLILCQRLMTGPDERWEFKVLCRRIESTIRAWYNFEFEDLNVRLVSAFSLELITGKLNSILILLDFLLFIEGTVEPIIFWIMPSDPNL